MKNEINNEINNEIKEVTLEDIIDRIKCNFDQEPIQLSNIFWDHYEQIKKSIEKDSDKKYSNISDLSLEQKAKNNIKTLLNSNLDELREYRDFLKTLLEDLTDYGTLPYYTLRRIINLLTSKDKTQKTIQELKNLKDELGKNYLSKEIEKFKNIQKDITIAIENRNLF